VPARRLHKAAVSWEARVIGIQNWQYVLYGIAVEDLGIGGMAHMGVLKRPR